MCLEVSTMMYPYLTLNDNTEITHSEMKEDGSVKVYIETPDETGGFRRVVSIVLRKLLLNRLDCPTPDRVSVVKGAVHLSCP